VQWRPEDASPSGLAFAGGSLWLGALQGERLWGVPVEGNRVVGEPWAYSLGDYGRLRTVVAAPDGSLWVTTSNTDGRGDPAAGDDRILRVVLR
jgi:glucose/arabinose dehydrogenase